jgi:hypothetical protein
MGTITKETARTKSEISALLYAHVVCGFLEFTELAEEMLERYAKLNPQIEVKDSPKEVTENNFEPKYSDHDMRVFGGRIQRSAGVETSSATIELLLSNYKASKFSPKEEPKEFTLKDMLLFAPYFTDMKRWDPAMDNLAIIDRWLSRHNPK